MKIALYMIQGGDYQQAGKATENLKQLLKKISIDPADMRRAIVAAFEAEMNVVIHAYKGNMRVILDTNEIEVEIRDEGPGIPDIAKAMQEGYSTAPPAARKLGYGAGLGLPNMKKSSDLFEISSQVGKGTKVVFSVKFRPQKTGDAPPNSIRTGDRKCPACMRCVRTCPTGAIRVREQRPFLLPQLCIDCGACLKACGQGFISCPPAPRAISLVGKIMVAVPPFLAQFTAKFGPARVLAALGQLGCGKISIIDAWEDALKKAVAEYARERAKALPLITPLCPAVTNLVTLKFHSLIENLAPFLSPLEAAIEELAGEKTVFMACCPSQMTALSAPGLAESVEAVTPHELRLLIQPLLIESELEQRQAEHAPAPLTRDPAINARQLEVSGIKHVIDALKKVENGRLKDVEVLNLFACDQGCFGSPFLTEEPFVARYRWERAGGSLRPPTTARKRKSPWAAYSGMRLDSDVSRAIDKVAEIEEALKELPVTDCALCGSPTCAEWAEDLVMGRTKPDACAFRGKTKGDGP